jgi:hypothetical protein
MKYRQKKKTGKNKEKRDRKIEDATGFLLQYVK